MGHRGIPSHLGGDLGLRPALRKHSTAPGRQEATEPGGQFSKPAGRLRDSQPSIQGERSRELGRLPASKGDQERPPCRLSSNLQGGFSGHRGAAGGEGGLGSRWAFPLPCPSSLLIWLTPTQPSRMNSGATSSRKPSLTSPASPAQAELPQSPPMCPASEVPRVECPRCLCPPVSCLPQALLGGRRRA